MENMEKMGEKEVQIATAGNNIRSLILQMKDQFAMALPKHITPDRFLRVALTAINKNPKLGNCTKESLLACLLDCSQIGLEPDGRKAHLIPYGNQCTLIVDYKGLVELVRRSGEIADIHADIICKNDMFEYSYGTNSTLIHKPNLADRGEFLGAYSFVKLKDGAFSFEVMGSKEIENVRKRSKAANLGPWVTDSPEMAKKTVFRRHSKWLPLSSEYQEALQKAIEKDFDLPKDIIDINSIKMGNAVKNPFLLDAKKEQKEVIPPKGQAEEFNADENPSELTPEERREYGLEKEQRGKIKK